MSQPNNAENGVYEKHDQVQYIPRAMPCVYVEFLYVWANIRLQSTQRGGFTVNDDGDKLSNNRITSPPKNLALHVFVARNKEQQKP